MLIIRKRISIKIKNKTKIKFTPVFLTFRKHNKLKFFLSKHQVAWIIWIWIQKFRFKFSSKKHPWLSNNWKFLLLVKGFAKKPKFRHSSQSSFIVTILDSFMVIVSVWILATLSTVIGFLSKQGKKSKYSTVMYSGLFCSVGWCAVSINTRILLEF